MTLVALGEETAAGTRARTLFSRLLSDRDYWELLDCDSVDEILERLKNTEGYARTLAALSSGIHRSELETHLEGIPFVEARRFLTSVTASRRDWLEAWLGLYDAETLNRVLRKIFSGHEGASGLEQRFHRVPGSSLPEKDLLAADNFDQILEALRGTPWFRVLQEPLKAALREGGNLFSAEMAVDALTLTRLVRTSRALTHSGKGSLSDLFGTLADLQNISWTIRGLHYFGMGFEEMINRLLPLRHRLSFDTLRRLGRSKGLDELWDHLGRTPYAAVFGPHPITDSMALEKLIKNHLWNKALSILRKGTPSFPALGAYLFLHDQEIRDIKMIIEDVRYDFNRRDAALFLARPLIRGGETSWHS
ncbi:MAG: V-type ATPase subunit [Thermovirgaceae bacterium]|nr:V-type ATPase subunit [Thermovirgaceae bacterium]